MGNFHSRVDQLAGPGAIDCGRNRFGVMEPIPARFPAESPHDPPRSRDPLPCLNRALESGNAFKMVHQGFPFPDYENIWHAFVGDAQGRFWQVQFDFAHPPASRLERWPCPAAMPLPLDSLGDLLRACPHPAARL